MTTPQAMTEKDAYRAAFGREYETTLKVIKAFPPAQAELKPHEKMKNARELGWMLAATQGAVLAVMQDELKPGGIPPVPATWAEVVTGVESMHRDAKVAIAKLDEARYNAPLKMPVGPNQMGDVRRGDALWFFLNDSIHHRGQFSVYLRMAGGKVPSIYGPTADERW